MRINWVGTLQWIHNIGHYIRQISLFKITNFLKPIKRVSHCSVTTLWCIQVDYHVTVYTRVKQCTFHLLISNGIAQNDMVLNILVIHHLVMITCISYETMITFAGLVSRISLQPLFMWHLFYATGGKWIHTNHYNDVIMTTYASQITSLALVYSTVYSDADQGKHQSSASLAFVWGIHRDRWTPRTKGQLRGKCFHLMKSSCD